MVLADSIRDHFLIVQRSDGNNARIDQLGQQRIFGRHKHLVQGDRPQQLSLTIHKVERVDGFLIHPGFLDDPQCVTDGHVRRELAVFDCHQGTG
ncbi:hypothetical protein SDC9_175667 [bioreactor metagenome]|uniref:Uncharacterized protein n=1 Tax=bioreactor metagenome TaxID=1076179 RepID=A0A645GPW3_9ZZZZ